MFMATARIDAIWVHDGLLDARDYKTGRLWHERVADAPAAKVQAFVLDKAARRRDLRLRLRYEFLSPDVADDPDPWEPDHDDLATIEGECASSSRRMRTNDDWKGVADGRLCSPAVPDRSAATAPPRRSSGRSSPPRRGRTAPEPIGPPITSRRADPPLARHCRSRAGFATRRGRRCAQPHRSPRRRGPSRRCRHRGEAVVARSRRRDRDLGDRLVALCRPGRAARAEARDQPRATAVSTVGGNSPQLLVNEMAERIQRNELDVALIGGAEAMHTRWRARREPRVELTWDTGDDPPCEWVIGDGRPGASDYESAHFAMAPPLVYPLFETALRHAAGRTVDDHQRHVSELWARFSAVAAGNPNAWSRTAYSAEEIRTVSPDNRMVVFPYTKRMCANIDVDQGAALLLCSYEAAPRRACPTIAWCTCTRRPSHTTTTSSASGGPSRTRRGSRAQLRTPSTRPASRSTTSPGSISIRAFPRRCRL